MNGYRQFWIFAGQIFWQCLRRDYSATIKSHCAQTISSLVEILWSGIVGQGKINGGLYSNKSLPPQKKSYTPASMLTCTLLTPQHKTHQAKPNDKRQFLLQAYFLIQKQNKNFVYNFSFFVSLLHGRLLVTAPPCSHRHTKSSTASKGGWTHLCRPPPTLWDQTPSERQ